MYNVYINTATCSVHYQHYRYTSNVWMDRSFVTMEDLLAYLKGSVFPHELVHVDKVCVVMGEYFPGYMQDSLYAEGDEPF